MMNRVRRLAPFALIVAAVTAAYANALHASFQFDDWNVIVDEPRVHGLAAWWQSMPGIRPLLKLSYALNYAIAAGPAGYRAVNVAIHAANACLIFALLAKRSAPFAALATALIFALHPVQTEAVTYVMGRSSSLSTLFVLASLLASGWIAPTFFASALLVKETAVMAIVAKWKQQRWDGTDSRSGAPAFFVVLAALAMAALALASYRHLLSVSFQTRGIGTNLLSQAHGVVYLMGQLVRFDRLNVDPNLPVVASWTWPVALDAACIVGSIALGFALLKKHPAVGLGILWFFLWLLPTNSVVPRLDVANDRQLYLALAGPAWIVAYGLAQTAKLRGTRLPTAAVALLCLGLAIATHLRNRVYADELTFWTDVVAKAPDNARAHNNLGYALALRHRDADAEAEFRKSLELDPSYFKAAINLKFLEEGVLRDRRGVH
jgi:hypothetical protein